MNKQKNSSNPLIYDFFFILGGLALGVITLGPAGSIFGGILGYIVASIVSLRGRLGYIEEALSSSSIKSQEEPSDGPGTEEMDNEVEEELILEPESSIESGPPPFSGISYDDDEEGGESSIYINENGILTESLIKPEKTFQKETSINKANHLLKIIWYFFTSGNVILKIGMIILFFGVSFLLKYAAQRNLFPIEFRLIAVTLGGLALLIIGWKLRHRQMVYGLLLQGGGVGILYLTVFAAARLYQLLPFVLAFSVMVCIVALTGFLAVLQNEKWMAVFGSAGGFLAPVLLSTGGGSHIALFTYYLILNLGIFGISWFKAWRELNLLGFVFTYAIGALWGSSYYRTVYFASIEPFLLTTFILYVAVSILFSLKQPVALYRCISISSICGMGIALLGYSIRHSIPTALQI